MWGWVVAGLALWCLKPRPEKDGSGGRPSEFAALAPSLQAEAQECVRTINRTGSVEVGIRCFQTIKENARRLFEIVPPTGTVYLQINGRNIETSADLHLLDEARDTWVEEFFSERIEAATRAAGLLTDPALKAAQLKKALHFALKAVGYAPDALAAKERVREIEKAIVALREH